jgi:hypothetical protein
MFLIEPKVFKVPNADFVDFISIPTQNKDGTEGPCLYYLLSKNTLFEFDPEELSL